MYQIIIIKTRNEQQQEKNMELEQVLPNDMIGEILGRLSNHDLFQYGCTSKRCLRSANDIWKTRYQKVRKYFEKIMNHSAFSSIQKWENLNDESEPCLIQDDLGWYKMYNKVLHFSILNEIKSYLIESNNTDCLEFKAYIGDSIFKIIYDHRIIFNSKKFKEIDFEKVVNMKLYEFMNGSEFERQIAHKYYPLLFWGDYQSLMIEVETDDEVEKDGRDEPYGGDEEDCEDTNE